MLRGKLGGYQIRDPINIRRGIARIAHDQAEHLTTLVMLVQNGLESRRITRLVIFGIEFVSMLPVIGFDFNLSSFSKPAGMAVWSLIKFSIVTHNTYAFCIVQRARDQ
jgi:hypothetical protein